MDHTHRVPPHLDAAVFFAGFGGGLGCDLDDEDAIAHALRADDKVIHLPAKTPPPKVETGTNG